MDSTTYVEFLPRPVEGDAAETYASSRVYSRGLAEEIFMRRGRPLQPLEPYLFFFFLNMSYFVYFGCDGS